MSRSEPSEELRLLPGRPTPLGATVVDGGVNFAVVSESAQRVELVLFSPADRDRQRAWRLDPRRHRTGCVWHALVAGAGVGWEYGYRVRRDEGPRGLRGDAARESEGDPSSEARLPPLLLDPYARGVSGAAAWGEGEPRRARRSRVVASVEAVVGAAPWRRSLAESVIYELHLRGFTRHPSSAVAHPGTYRGLIEKIPYLEELGVTTVELLPIAEFEENDNPRTNPDTGERLLNYWGYQPLAFFAPKAAYAAESGSEELELREMVDSFHAAGIEVLLDVVLNHTGEGDAATGWTLSWRGLDEEVYYLVDESSGALVDVTGCGNTLRCQHPVVRRLLVDCLRRWVLELGVDGFRFDLASVLARGRDGEPLAAPPLLEEIATDPVLREIKLIAEPWDLGGQVQVGSFPGFGRFAEWNGRFRDDIRRFVRGDGGSGAAAMQRLLGSPDLYAEARRPPWHSINYVTSHDGFTLADLVSYERKRNRANGEGERDGSDHEVSWSCGAEGTTDDARILTLRRRQVKSLLALLLLARGVPMILGGDEMGRSQAGNNNAYCQDNEISWIDWSLVERDPELVRFVRALLRLRAGSPTLRRADFVAEAEDDGPVVLATEPPMPDEAPYFALRLGAPPGSDERLLVLANATDLSVSSDLPADEENGAWCRMVDTALAAPGDVDVEGRTEVGRRYGVAPRSVVLLVWRSS